MGGFIVLDIKDSPLNAALNGTVAIDGIVYTTGEFSVNGGGNTVNINGSIFASSVDFINGNTSITYNDSYIRAVLNLNILNDAELIAWFED